jgi:hypothetical protein
MNNELNKHIHTHKGYIVLINILDSPQSFVNTMIKQVILSIYLFHLHDPTTTKRKKPMMTGPS